MTLATPTLGSLQWSGVFNQQMLLLTENWLQCQKWSPLRKAKWRKMA